MNRTATEKYCIPPLLQQPMRSRSVARYVVPSLRLPRLASKERLGMTLEIVCEHSQRPRRAAHFLQSAAYLLDLRGIRLGECAGIVESAARARQRALCADQGCIQLGDRLL